MLIENIEYVGVDWAIKSVAQSFSLTAWERAKKAAYNLWTVKNLHSGEAKHLEFITLYFEMEMARYFWQEFDTYRIGIADNSFWLTKYSESTMHTILKRHLILEDFEIVDDEDSENLVGIINKINSLIDEFRLLNKFDIIGKFRIKYRIKKLLPESFLQNRVIKTDAKTLMYIMRQRREHELPEWKYFCGVFENLIKEIKEELVR